jgi:hypothetical protein
LANSSRVPLSEKKNPSHKRAGGVVHGIGPEEGKEGREGERKKGRICVIHFQ